MRAGDAPPRGGEAPFYGLAARPPPRPRPRPRAARCLIRASWYAFTAPSACVMAALNAGVSVCRYVSALKVMSCAKRVRASSGTCCFLWVNLRFILNPLILSPYSSSNMCGTSGSQSQNYDIRFILLLLFPNMVCFHKMPILGGLTATATALAGHAVFQEADSRRDSSGRCDSRQQWWQRTAAVAVVR